MSNLYDNIRKSREKKGGPRTKKDSTIDPKIYEQMKKKKGPFKTEKTEKKKDKK